jgi:uncharacterized protein (TIGR02284 family)
MKFESTKLNFNVMSESSQKIRQLNQLLIINNNAEKAYLEALEIANDEGLKQFFRARAFERSEFCRYLGAEIRVLGGEPSYAGEGFCP